MNRAPFSRSTWYAACSGSQYSARGASSHSRPTLDVSRPASPSDAAISTQFRRSTSSKATRFRASRSIRRDSGEGSTRSRSRLPSNSNQVSRVRSINSLRRHGTRTDRLASTTLQTASICADLRSRPAASSCDGRNPYVWSMRVFRLAQDSGSARTAAADNRTSPIQLRYIRTLPQRRDEDRLDRVHAVLGLIEHDRGGRLEDLLRHLEAFETELAE